jgi:hypothetical protein
MKMVCNCGTELIWGGNNTYDEMGIEGDGIVSNYTCPNEECGVELVEVYEDTSDNSI